MEGWLACDLLVSLNWAGLPLLTAVIAVSSEGAVEYSAVGVEGLAVLPVKFQMSYEHTARTQTHSKRLYLQLRWWESSRRKVWWNSHGSRAGSKGSTAVA